MKTLHMTDQQHRALLLLVERGAESMRQYLKDTKDPRMDGYSDEETADLRQLDTELEELEKVANGTQPPPGYLIFVDGIHDPYYAVKDDDVGTIVTGTYATREEAVRDAWKDYERTLGGPQ